MNRSPRVVPGAAFLRSEGLRRGLRKHVLDGPGYRTLFSSVRVAVTHPRTVAVEAQAALLVSHPSAVISHHSAALLWGGVVPETAHVHVSVGSRTHRPRRPGIRGHVSSRTTAPSLRDGLPVTSAIDTFLDLAPHLELVDLVVLGDSLVKARSATPDALRDGASGWHGAGAVGARRAAALVRAKVDSPMETRLRLLLVFAGLPEPVVNLAIHDDLEGVVYRLDLAFEGVLVAVEYDGRQHAENDRQWGRDVTRREDLEGRGWRLIICRSPDIYATPMQTVQRVVDALRDRGATIPSDVPREAARRHFPGYRDRRPA